MIHTKKTVDTIFFKNCTHTQKLSTHFFFKCVDNFFLNLVIKNWKAFTKNWKMLTKNWKVLTKTILFVATAHHSIWQVLTIWKFLLSSKHSTSQINSFLLGSIILIAILEIAVNKCSIEKVFSIVFCKVHKKTHMSG